MKPIELKKRSGMTWQKIADACGLKHHDTAARWHHIPDKYLIALETALGIPRGILRPDLYRGETTPHALEQQEDHDER